MANVTSTAHVARTVTLAEQTLYEFYGAPSPDGVTEKSLSITLPRNALVNKYEVIVTAATAHAVTAGAAGQLRTNSISGGTAIVLDFGTLRTVSAVGAPAGVLIKSITSWIGTEFASPPKATSETGRNFFTLPSELRTERLQVVVGGNPTTAKLATDMVLVLPESPAGVELRIDGGPPVFAQAAAVDPSDSSALSTQAWNTNSQRVVDLGPALAALTGNPLDETSVTFTPTLTSRVPGVLDLQPRPGGQDVLRIRRATFNSQPSRVVAFDVEGQQLVALESLPASLAVRESRMTIVGAPPALRVVPPVGPEPPDPVFASLSLTTERAACILVPQEPRFAELHGVRVPLAAGSSGAEVRVVLWQSASLDDVTPVEVVPNATSSAVTIATGEEDWRTFSWSKPVPIPADGRLWAVVTVTRGEASITLADVSAGIGAERLLWGAPGGPWHDLPDALASARGRIRAIGKPRPDAAYPPLNVALSGAPLSSVTPTARGVPVTLSGPGSAPLVLTSHAAASVTLHDVDVISDN